MLEYSIEECRYICGDIFAYIPENIAFDLSYACSMNISHRCVCAELTDFYRKSIGVPTRSEALKFIKLVGA